MLKSIMNSTDQKDTIYAQAHEAVGAFQFDESVVAVFPDMIQRSVPGYQTILTGIGELTPPLIRRFQQYFSITPKLSIYFTLYMTTPHVPIK